MSSVSNREVSDLAGVNDQGQISKMMMARLQEQGLVENMRGGGKGVEKAWRLTAHGEAVLDAHHTERPSRGGELVGVSGGKLVAKRGRAPSSPVPPASPRFRLTVRTHMVLAAVAERVGPSNREIAQAAGVRDEGQISRLLARLERSGLVQNTGRGQGQGAPNEWSLTPAGQKLEQNIRERAREHERQAA